MAMATIPTTPAIKLEAQDTTLTATEVLSGTKITLGKSNRKQNANAISLRSVRKWQIDKKSRTSNEKKAGTRVGNMKVETKAVRKKVLKRARKGDSNHALPLE